MKKGHGCNICKIAFEIASNRKPKIERGSLVIFQGEGFKDVLKQCACSAVLMNEIV